MYTLKSDDVFVSAYMMLCLRHSVLFTHWRNRQSLRVRLRC